MLDFDLLTMNMWSYSCMEIDAIICTLDYGICSSRHEYLMSGKVFRGYAITFLIGPLGLIGVWLQ